MDQWLDRIAADTSSDGPQRKAARNKPDGLQDACWESKEEMIADPGRCDEMYPPFADPRIVAGEPVIGETLKCTLKPVDAKDYKQALSDGQFARLKSIFPEGTCDFSRPGVGQSKLGKTWISYGDK